MMKFDLLRLLRQQHAGIFTPLDLLFSLLWRGFKKVFSRKPEEGWALPDSICPHKLPKNKTKISALRFFQGFRWGFLFLVSVVFFSGGGWRK